MPTQGGDPYRPYRPGETAAIDHRAINAWQRAARAENDRQTGLGALPARGPRLSQTIVQVQLYTALDAYEIVTPTGPVLTPTQNLREFQDRPVFGTASPAAADPFAILLEPGPAGAIVDAVFAGIVAAKIQLNNPGDSYVTALDLDPTQLQSATVGGFGLILYRDPTTSWGLVYVAPLLTVGLTQDITVVTGFDELTCVATTAILQFVSGLLVGVA